MRSEEAARIGRTLENAEGPVLELGSSTLHFRTVVQPHIDLYIHKGLRERGVKVVHSDLKQAEGVDVSGDFNDPAVRARLRQVKARTLLCCNMFEHVTDRGALAALCDELLQPGGRLVVSVPYSYPLHLDPIDTYFRPTPEEIAAMFPDYLLEEAQIVRSDSYLSSVLASPRKELSTIARNFLAVWAGPRRWAARNHRLLWLVRPYEVSVAVLKKPPARSSHDEAEGRSAALHATP